MSLNVRKKLSEELLNCWTSLSNIKEVCMATREDYNIGQVPSEARFFTTAEVGKITGYSSCTLTTICRKLKIYPERVLVNSRYVKRYSYEQYRSIMDYKLERENKQKKSGFDESKLSLEELFKRHPLETNPAFFKVEYFPNVTPACFEEIDSWVV